jgi:2-iminobutanoate/2-iminopropanoate deaminase
MGKQHIYFSDDHSTPYCDMVVVEDRYLFLSGLVSQDLTTGELVFGDTTFETKQILDNLKVILERYGSDMQHVIRAEVLLKTFAERDLMNAEYIKHFNPEHMPARLCYGDVGLAGECKVEIMVTAVKK